MIMTKTKLVLNIASEACQGFVAVRIHSDLKPWWLQDKQACILLVGEEWVDRRHSASLPFIFSH